jgi:CDP-diacylglycerol---glycerol-3-phosphate 3-phosphatidyltransferase
VSVVSPGLRTRIRGIATPIAVAMGRVGLSPNALTLIGFGIAILAAVAAGLQSWVIAGILVVFGGVFDLFDGALARATGTTSKLGAFMDSVFDRWGEGVVYVGIAIGCVNAGFGLGAALSTAALASAFMVSYARAKSEGLGFTEGTGMAAVGLAPREVRIVILTLGLLVAGFLGGATGQGATVLAVALGLITVLATITVIQRIVHVLRQPIPEEHE